MKANKLLFSIFAIMLMLSAMSICVFANETSVVVSTQAELVEYLNDDNITSIKIANDIALSEEWMPVVISKGRTLEIIGSGDGITISNMIVHEALENPRPSAADASGGSNYYCSGFIGYNEGSIVMKNITFSNASVDAEKAFDKM